MNLLDYAKAYTNGAKILTEWVGSGGESVDLVEAQRRANICFQCPLNKEGLTVAESVSTAIKEQMELKKHISLKVHGEDGLHTCSACLCPLPLKVWIKLDKILPDEELKTKLDPKCWLLETHE